MYDSSSLCCIGSCSGSARLKAEAPVFSAGSCPPPPPCPPFPPPPGHYLRQGEPVLFHMNHHWQIFVIRMKNRVHISIRFTWQIGLLFRVAIEGCKIIIYNFVVFYQLIIKQLSINYRHKNKREWALFWKVSLVDTATHFYDQKTDQKRIWFMLYCANWIVISSYLR